MDFSFFLFSCDLSVCLVLIMLMGRPLDGIINGTHLNSLGESNSLLRNCALEGALLGKVAVYAEPSLLRMRDSLWWSSFCWHSVQEDGQQCRLAFLILIVDMCIPF